MRVLLEGNSLCIMVLRMAVKKRSDLRGLDAVEWRCCVDSSTSVPSTWVGTAMEGWIEEFTVKGKPGGVCLIEIWYHVHLPFWLLHNQNFCSCPRSTDEDTTLSQVKKLPINN